MTIQPPSLPAAGGLACAFMVTACLTSMTAAGDSGSPRSNAPEPNPPTWPSTVRVFSPSDTDIEDVVNAAYAKNGGHTPPNNGQFSDARYAFLFKPGTYTATIPVGYYTSIAGLGASPLDVVFTGDMGVFCPEGPHRDALAVMRTQCCWSRACLRCCCWAP